MNKFFQTMEGNHEEAFEIMEQEACSPRLCILPFIVVAALTMTIVAKAKDQNAITMAKQDMIVMKVQVR